MLQLAILERKELESQLEKLEREVIATLTPKDAADERGVVLEVRAGTGFVDNSVFTNRFL